VGAAEAEEDEEPFEEKMKRLTETLEVQFTESGKLEQKIRGSSKNLEHDSQY
jgi:type I restriction enzyme M protein